MLILTVDNRFYDVKKEDLQNIYTVVFAEQATLIFSHLSNYTDTFIILQNATQKSQKVFVHVPSEIAAHEVEEIGMPLDEKPHYILPL